MSNAIFTIKKPLNEVALIYRKGSSESDVLAAELKRQAALTVEIPCIINGREVRTGDLRKVVEPHRHANTLANFHAAGKAELDQAVKAALAAKSQWESMPWEHRASVFLKAAELLTGPYRVKMTAATMLGQSKNPYEAEIDAICELADFLRFGAWQLQEIYRQQPDPSPNAWNRIEYRPLEGFVAALAPFNFTSIGGNLACAPALAGNVVVWKPSSAAALSSYYFMQILMEAGLPAGVINFLPCSGLDFGERVVGHPSMAGFHFTGSTGVFNGIWNQVGGNIAAYHSYPRLVGETGGKDYVFAHPSANAAELTAGLIRGAFSFQGQKCSATSRTYIPASLWPEVRERLEKELQDRKPGDIRDNTCFLNAVIDRKSFSRIQSCLEDVKKAPDAEIIIGGSCDDSVGYFIEPTVILAENPVFRTMKEELFGPVLTVYVYEDTEMEEAVRLCNETSEYALCGGIYAKGRENIQMLEAALAHSAGNFYINDKTTGAVVGQQPFGGAGNSGTNDKAGSVLNLYRWLSLRTIKENFLPQTAIDYPCMEK